jgi:hypothetical protein
MTKFTGSRASVPCLQDGFEYMYVLLYNLFDEDYKVMHEINKLAESYAIDLVEDEASAAHFVRQGQAVILRSKRNVVKDLITDKKVLKDFQAIQSRFEADFEEKNKDGSKSPQTSRLQKPIANMAAVEFLTHGRRLNDQIRDSGAPHVLMDPARILASVPEEARDKALAELKGATLFGIAANTSYTGVEGHGLPVARLQISGNRLIVTCQPDELFEIAGISQLKDTRKWFQDLCPQVLEPLQKFKTLKVGEVMAGDTLYMPTGAIYAERSLNVNNISIRFHTFAATPVNTRSWLNIYKSTLQTEIMKAVFVELEHQTDALERMEIEMGENETTDDKD